MGGAENFDGIKRKIPESEHKRFRELHEKTPKALHDMSLPGAVKKFRKEAILASEEDEGDEVTLPGSDIEPDELKYLGLNLPDEGNKHLDSDSE